MLLKSLKLQDFRQFKGTQIVHFSTDKNKNVTIMMGDNGSGKTSFAQAFRWCLYGDTDFKDTKLLSKKVAIDMLPGDEKPVEVAIELIHENVEYTITRRLLYKKNTSGDIVAAPASKFVIQFKDATGNIQYVRDLETEAKMNEILPADLSRYFFFDGERIEKMGDDIKRGKSKEFSEAVRSLLGLNSYVQALKHLKENPNNVIRAYRNSYLGGADGKMEKLKNDINTYEARLKDIDTELERVKSSIAIDSDNVVNLKLEISKNNTSTELMKQREECVRKIKNLENDKNIKTKMFLGYFNDDQVNNYFTMKMMYESLSELKGAEKLDKGIPHIHAETIDYLIKNGKCICGTKLEIGSEHYNALNELRNYIPPKSIGNLIGDFTTACELRAKGAASFKNEMEDKYRSIRQFTYDKSALEEEKNRITEKLSNLKDVSKLSQELSIKENNLARLNEKLESLIQDKGVAENEKGKAETELNNLSLTSVKNQEIGKYMAYAEYVYDVLKADYTKKEDETREKLADTVNTIFKKIYDGGFSLSLDKQYNIELTASAGGYTVKPGDNLDTSTAQSISIIFAFIAGVIEMNKNNQSASSEAYPLVMDAPLSAFDTTRIATVCDVLPKVAEQVIIFIKDTDGDLAEKNMAQKIGTRYTFVKIDDLETKIMG